ncbi:MAG: TraR/DksA family transcriptional regulator [bacterium]|nr:TraR/DksA family transcriptional regulator [bacterium]MCP5068142.1 TraR/DksA family transcriptional regulator [bacterium]
MTPAEEEALRADLEKLRQELTTHEAATEQSARPVDLDQPIGRISRVDALQQQQLAKTQRDAARLRLQQVAAALDRLERGDYGECISCGEEIEFRRLKARPESPLCLPCQRRREARS